MSHELKMAVLDALDKEPCSTKALMSTIDGFSDREYVSLFLHDMASHELIRKQSNGYWKCTEAGQGLLAGMDIEVKEQLAPAEVTQPESEPGLEDQPKPSCDNPPVSNTWPAIALLRKSMPESASLVIEHDAAFLVFAGNQFELGREGDLEALTRMVECHIGNINGYQVVGA